MAATFDSPLIPHFVFNPGCATLKSLGFGISVVLSVSLEACPALVLNADFRPLSYFPLSLWSWQETIKAVFLERVQVVQEYDQLVRSPSWEMKLPSVICLKKYAPMERSPAFTRFNVFLRDHF